MAIGDRCHEIEAQAITGRSTASIQSVKWAKDLVTLIMRDTGTVVLYPKDEQAVGLGCADLDRGSSRGMPTGILNEITKHLEQQFTVSANGDFARMTDNRLHVFLSQWLV